MEKVPSHEFSISLKKQVKSKRRAKNSSQDSHGFTRRLYVSQPLLLPFSRRSHCSSLLQNFLKNTDGRSGFTVPAFFCGIGSASKSGVLIKGSNFVEVLSKAKIAVFDKTGTLTKGIFDVAQVNPTNGFTNDSLLAIATHAESYSNHPISKSLKKAHHCVLCDALKILEPEEISGFGIRAVLEGKAVLAGNAKLMKEKNVTAFEETTNDRKLVGTIVHVAVDGIYAGSRK